MITILTVTPAWFLFSVLFFLAIGILPIGRKKLEGFPYNISMASAYGDVALIAIILLAQEVLKREGGPQWMNSRYQMFAAAMCIFIGIFGHGSVVLGSEQWGETMDTYHNIFIVPLLVYFTLFVSLPVVITKGGVLESAAMFLLGAVWFITFFFDLREGRLQQRKYLEAHPVTQV